MPQVAAAIIVKLVIQVAVAAVLALASKALAKKPRTGRVRIEQEYSGTVEPRRILFGELKVSGMNILPPLVSGPKAQYLHQALVCAGHEGDSISDVYFNSDKITSASIGSVTGTDDDGLVASGTYANKAWIRRYTGSADQTVDYLVHKDFPSWDGDHRGVGNIILFLRWKLDQKLYASGKPDIWCVARGYRVYDPRKDSTNGGSGSHRTNDPTTWEWSDNPALCLRHYLTCALGLEDDHSRIDDALCIAAANICDETVTIPPASPPTTQKRYTCNVVLLATQRYEDNIDILADAMLGHCFWSGGKWRMYAGCWPGSSSFDLNDDDLIDNNYTVETELPKKDKFSAVRGTFVDAARQWQPVEFKPRQSATYRDADGETQYQYLDVEYPACTNEYEAERNGIIQLRKSRRGKSFVGRFGFRAYKIRPFSVGTLSIADIGWTNQAVRCESWRFVDDGFEISLRAEASSDWNDPAVSDYGDPTTATDPALGTYEPEEPSGLTATGVVNGVQLSWTAPAVFLPTDRYELYEYSSSTPFSSATMIWSGTATRVILAKGDITVRYYWLLVRNAASNNTSDVVPSDAGPGVAGGAAAISNTLTASVSASNIAKTGTTSSLTTDSVTVTPNSGTSPYTYAWTRLSGSTSISANSASAATTTFTGTPLNPGDSISAVFRCTVTDNVAATKTVDVNVTITRSAMSATASPASLIKSVNGSSATTASVTVTPSGGTATYTYSWAKLSGDTFTITSPTAASTTFSKTGLTNGDYLSGVYRCTVTDSSSPAKTATVDVSVVIRNTNPN